MKNISSMIQYILIRFPFGTRISVFIVLPLLLALLGIWVYLRSGLPAYSGQLRISGISASIEITRDTYGVVSVIAGTDEDVFFAVGYSHAQDRLWQLEYMKRQAEGRLSEVLGKAYFSQDKWFRILDLDSASEQAMETLSEDVQIALDAYADGINTWLQNNDILPVEFLLYSITPGEWEAKDSILLAKLFALNLSGNFNQELTNLSLAKKLSDSQFNALLPRYPNTNLSDVHLVAANIDENFGDFYDLVTSNNKTGEGAIALGSNAWVIGPEWTESGGALLANDPHLSLEVPSPWYAVNLKGSDLNVSGATLVGLPMVIVGRNQDIAWGITNMAADTQDLYLEFVNSSDFKQYSQQGEWSFFDLQEETIEIKADFPTILNVDYKPITFTTRRTLNGPIVNDISGRADAPLALRTTVLDSDDTSIEAFYRLNYAATWSDFRQALSKLVVPALNVVYADNSGNIGYQGAGKVPIRNKGDGIFPVDGSDSAYYWNGYINFENMPRSFNPKTGYIVNANDKVETFISDAFISYEWSNPARASRIRQLIKKNMDNGVLVNSEDNWKIQMDVLDQLAIEVIGVIEETEGMGADQHAVMKHITSWDGIVGVDSWEPTIFFIWMKELRRRLFDDELNEAAGHSALPDDVRSVVDNSDLSVILNVLRHSESNWCDDVSTTALESCSDILSESFADSIQLLENWYGRNIDNWHWGDLHTVTYNHLGGSNHLFVNNVFNLKAASTGSQNTINFANVIEGDDHTYTQTVGASFRQIVDMQKDNTKHYFLQPTGQSGNPLSENYGDMLEVFHDKNSNNLINIKGEAPVSSTMLLPITQP